MGLRKRQPTFGPVCGDVLPLDTVGFKSTVRQHLIGSLAQIQMEERRAVEEAADRPRSRAFTVGKS